MSVVNELSDTVRKCARQVERMRNGVWVTESSDDESGPSDRTIAWMTERGLLCRSGSGAGRGLKVDSEVAAVLGMPEFDDS